MIVFFFAKSSLPQDNQLQPIKAGLVYQASIQDTVERFQPLFNYLEKHLPVRIEPQWYDNGYQLITDIKSGTVDLVFADGVMYLYAGEKLQANQVAVMRAKGSFTRRAIIIVRKDSGLQSLSELRGKRVALVGPFDALSTLWLQYKLELQGETLNSFFHISESPKMLAVFELVQKVAPTDSSVLIQGESGTGKELIAGALHYYSKRSQDTFISVNCSAFPETLLESELFGYEKGAFTGAQTRKKGLMEAVHGGTLFLDEIGEMPFPLQSKLLRAIEEREFLSVGGRAPIRVDVRIICSTNKDLKKEVEEGRFRVDLFYRFNVVAIYLPPLRERLMDVPFLVAHFLEKYSEKTGKKEP